MYQKLVIFNASALLQKYAAQDAQAAGLLLPKGLVDTEDLAAFMSCAGDVLFLSGDPNHDNEKRNIAIRVFLTFPASQIFDFCGQWLEKWTQNKSALWHQEWCSITQRANPVELTDILLSHEEQRVRQRLSCPAGEMLDFETILQIKRSAYRSSGPKEPLRERV